MDRWSRFIDWCQRPSRVKVRSFNPRNAVVLVTISIVLASSIAFGTWTLAGPPNVPEYTWVNPESLRTLTITKDTTLTEDHFGNIVIAADGVTLDGDGHSIIGPSPDIYIMDPNIKYGYTIGILLEERTGVTIKNCHVTGFGSGFLLYDSDENTLKGNTANDNAWTGFSLDSSSDNILLNNTANNIIEGDGFCLGMSFRNTLKGNTANNNSCGFSVEEGGGNIFEANTVNANTRRGFHVTSGNIIFHNNLIDNPMQALGWGPNTWDDGHSSGGNYWSDYEGVDENGDGIGDTPYVIDENNVDNFPLMNPVSILG